VSLDFSSEDKSLSALKETEIGLLPTEWRVMPLDKVATFTRKPRSLDLSQFDEIPFVPMAQIPENGNDIKGYELRAGDDIKSGTYCEKGNILLAKITPSFENGKQVVLDSIPLDFAYATTEVYAFDANPKFTDQMFLFYYFRLPRVRADLAGRMEGSTGRQRIRKNTIVKYPVIVPPLPEQRRIAGALRIIQEAIAVQEDVIAAARELKHSLMERLFTYGPGAEPAPTKETEIGTIPEHWELVPLKYFALDFFSGGTPSTKREDFWGGDISWTTSAHIEGISLSMGAKNITKKGLQESSSNIVPKDNLLIGTRVGVGKIAINRIVLAISQDLTGLIVDKARANTRYLAYVLLSERSQTIINTLTRGSTIQGISRGDLIQIPIPNPPIEEQILIAENLQSIDAKIAAEEQSKAALEDLFRSTLEQLMTGQIRLREEPTEKT
jgi:type I restriction enzyme, S subunit